MNIQNIHIGHQNFRIIRAVVWVLWMVVAVGTGGVLTGCRNEPVAEANIVFSVDTLTFDTVFTAQGSATRIVMLRNETRTPLTIDKVSMEDGSSFLLNLDGEDSIAYMRGIQVPAGDSLYLFVRASIDPQDSSSPVLVSDKVTFFLNNGNSRTLILEAYGQDVTLIDSMALYSNYTFTADKPYLVRYFIASAPEAHVTIESGATFYMHKDATAHFYGPLSMNGTTEAPIVFCGDRRDDYISGIPYLYVPGQWAGVYLYDTEGTAPAWEIANVRILSAINGLFCYGMKPANKPTLHLTNTRIHNMDQYGLVLQDVNAVVANNEISNCASYCVYVAGGEATFVHNTIASYYRHTAYNSNVGLYDTPREDVAAVYINDISKDRSTRASFYNNIITGVRTSQLTIAAAFPDLYTGTFRGNYLKNDTLRLPHAERNTYWQDSDSVFVNDYYADYQYFDFRLDSLSPARGVGDSIIAKEYPTDLSGNARTAPDAGCYGYGE